VDGAKKNLDQLVAADKITAAQRDDILSRLRANVDDLVQNGFQFGFGARKFPGFGFRNFDSFRNFDGFRNRGEVAPILPATAPSIF
jgi:hypothetical protein